MKKFSAGAAVLFAGMLSLISVAGCKSDKNTQPHTHVYNQSKWEITENYHYYPAVCGHDAIKRFDHVYDNDGDDTCNVCAYVRTLADVDNVTNINDEKTPTAEKPDITEPPQTPDAPSIPETPDEPAKPNDPETPDEPAKPNDTKIPDESVQPTEPETPELSHLTVDSSAVEAIKQIIGKVTLAESEKGKVTASDGNDFGVTVGENFAEIDGKSFTRSIDVEFLSEGGYYTGINICVNIPARIDFYLSGNGNFVTLVKAGDPENPLFDYTDVDGNTKVGYDLSESGEYALFVFGGIDFGFSVYGIDVLFNE